MGIFIAAYTVLVFAKLISLLDERDHKKFYCILLGLIYFLIAALRGRYVGGDTDIYVSTFQYLSTRSYAVAEVFADAGRDPFFYAFISFLGKIWCNYTFLFTVVALMFTVSVTNFIYKYSDDPFLSWVFMLAFNLYQFTLTAMRQTIAISFVLFAFSYFLEKKWFKSVIFIMIASLFHLSALCALLVFVFCKVKVNKKILYASFIPLIVIYLFKSRIATLFLSVFKEEGREYAVENKGEGLTMLLVITFIYVACMVLISKEKLEQSPVLQKLFVISFLALIFEVMVPTQSIFFRFAFYFLFAMAVLLPNVINNCIVKEKNVVYAVLFLILSIQYIFFTMGSCYITPYYTFWQDRLF